LVGRATISCVFREGSGGRFFWNLLPRKISTTQLRQGLYQRRLVIQHAADGRLIEIEPDTAVSLPLLSEPIPLQRNSYRYGDFLIYRDDSYRWYVAQGEQQLFQGAVFTACCSFVDSRLI